MKVIFIKKLKDQGEVNDIKEVSSGYATNFLIKNGYAVKYSKESLNRLNKEIKNTEEQNQNEIINAGKIKAKLEKEKLVFEVSCGKEDKVFGTISSKQIQEELSKKGYKIDKKNIIINDHIGALGIHNVNIELYKPVVAVLKIELIKK